MIENKIAVINCKAKKQKHACEAQEMYNVSFQFRSQIQFIEQYYDEYRILSSKYGLIKPTDVIEPYEISLAKGGRLKQQQTLTNSEQQTWTNKVKQQIKQLEQEFDEVDLHISNSYLKTIKELLNDKVKHIKQPINPGLVKLRYDEMSLNVINNESIDLNKIGEKRQSKDPEQKKWWYHKEHNKVFGYARDLKKQHKDVDEGNACRVSRGINKHTMGWVVDENVLKELEKTSKGKWRVKKQNNEN